MNIYSFITFVYDSNSFLAFRISAEHQLFSLELLLIEKLREEVMTFIFREKVINMQKIAVSIYIISCIRFQKKNFGFEKSQRCERFFPYFDN